MPSVIRLVILFHCVHIVSATSSALANEPLDHREQDARQITFTGETFVDRTYPTELELANIPLSDLIAIRPSNVRYSERDHFFHLFSLHEDVRRIFNAGISRDEYVRGSADLILKDKTPVADRRLAHSVTAYLKYILKVDKTIVADISRSVRKMRKRLSQQRRNSSVKVKDVQETEERRARYKEYRVRFRKDNFYKQKEGAAEFLALIQPYDIDASLPATELEVATRSLRNGLRGAENTTRSFKYFLNQRNPDDKDTDAAIYQRAKYNHHVYVNNFNMRQSREKRAQKMRETIIRTEEGVNQIQDGDCFQQLLSRSVWWY